MTGKELTTSRTPNLSSLPVPLNAKQAETLTRLSKCVFEESGRYLIRAKDAPDEALRGALAKRVDALKVWAVPDPDCAQKDLKSALRAYIGVLERHKATPAAQAEANVSLYAQALAGVPEWAAIEAVGMALRGELEGNPNFVPAPAVLVRAAKKAVERVRAEQWRIEKILMARIERDPPTPEQRAKVAEMAAALKAELAGGGLGAMAAQSVSSEATA